MKIHKRILISNTFMVLCALFALMLVNGWLFRHLALARLPEEAFAPLSEVMETRRLVNFFLGGFTSSVIIVGMSVFFTRKMARSILNPVDKLMAGAKRVERGDLTQRIDYAGDDEFVTLCEAFNHMQGSLAAYEQARTDMIAGISHDLRTPLTSVKGFIKGMLDGVAVTPERQLQYLSIAYKKACEMEVLINKLFFFSRLETGNLPMNRVEVELNGFIRRLAADGGAEIAVRASDTPLPVRIDPDHFTRVLNNLTDNAVKYARAQPLRLTVALSEDRGHAVLAFGDNGRGVEAAKLPRLFERFYRADESRQGADGSGLGLYIVKYITEAHGGTAAAENDGGLKITIRLPLAGEENDG